MHQAGRHLTLKRAARVLGVREQTLRTWGRRGVIRLIRAEGSGSYHVSEEEMGRLREQLDSRMPAANSVLSPPRTDEQSLALAEELAQLVLEDLQAGEVEGSLDESMRALRGRAWLE